MVAVVFPGQGSQQLGMGEDLWKNAPEAREVFDRVSKAVGIDMAELCFRSDDETLRQTENTQIALYTCGLAAWSALKAAMPGLKPMGMAGHSVGEYAALAAAGWLGVEDGAKLVRLRGELMGASGRERPGSMAALLGMEFDAVQALCQEVSGKGACVVANDNCPGQLVISGDVAAVQAAVELAPGKGAKRAMPLNVSGAFHSPLMEPSAAELGEALRKTVFAKGDVPVYSNVTTKPESGWADLLEAQLKSPVRWRESMGQMVADGATVSAECGHGQVLSGLLKRIDKSVAQLHVGDMASLEEAVAKLKEVQA